jgi:hypothetical protein
MTDEPTIEQLLEPSTVLSHALEFMETDLDADAYNVISAWVARAIREISEDLVRVEAIDREALDGLPAGRMKLKVANCGCASSSKFRSPSHVTLPPARADRATERFAISAGWR